MKKEPEVEPHVPHGTSLILENIQKNISITREEGQFFLSLLESRTLKKRDVHLRVGEVCKDSTFVVDGALKAFTVDRQGGEHVMNFAVRGWWIADMYSFISQQPGIMTIDALADSEVLMLSRENQEKLFQKVGKFERFFRILVENALVANQQRMVHNLSLTAEERYLHFMNKYPFILQCAPLHSIASYLGITPEFLSKIRRRLAGK